MWYVSILHESWMILHVLRDAHVVKYGIYDRLGSDSDTKYNIVYWKGFFILKVYLYFFL